jgi:hypothetical protein
MASTLARLGTAGIGLGLVVVALVSTDCAPKPANSPRTYPRHVLIIRHAEKPPEDAKSVDLSAQGKARAAALHKLFETSDARPRPFPKPDFIFAARNSGKSHRPVQTVTPVAAKLDLPIDARFTENAPEEVAGELFGNARYAGKTVLVSWRHGKTLELAKQLGATANPKKWDSGVYDRVWHITYDEQGNATLRDLPQRLMTDDSAR